MLTLTFVFLSGFAAGVFLTDKNAKICQFAKEYTDGFLQLRVQGSLFAVFSSTLFIFFVFLLLIFIFGTSVAGPALIPTFVALRGILVGSLVSVIYSQYSLKGIVFNTLVMIPPTVISVIVLILAAGKAMQMSLQIAKITLPETAPKNFSIAFKKYCIDFIVYSIPTALAALLDAWLSVKLLSVLNL